MAAYLLTYRTAGRGRCTTQVTSAPAPAAMVAKWFATENHVTVLRCQLLGDEAHLHPTEFCIYDAKDPYEPTMTQAPVHEPEGDAPEEEEEGEEK